ncbi:MmyB family transcriptional regulator [Streptomyces sp. NBC_01198]|uniref:MmyB family transcriptional regulator n=1 Tax=Streptomyces sp. NBC_01198 TaxID=2903769 RepID=UPI002E1532C8|nr:helix-turn-helix domain-containing protein [Streptomyces sp. NBC_01198]
MAATPASAARQPGRARPSSGRNTLSETSRKELGAFLRSRRERTEPSVAAARLPAGGRRRRTPGLRREEVSLLSGVSLTWYTWLEQGRDINVSPQILLALARALGLDGVERDHLFRLAGAEPPPAARHGASSPVSPALRAFLDAQSPNPALVVDRCFDILAWNDAEEALVGGRLDIDRPRAELNVLWLMFTEDGLTELFDDWDGEVRWLTAMLRGQTAYETDNPRFAELIEALLAASPLFRELWAAHDVAAFRSSARRFHHPVVGELDLSYVRLAVEDDPGRSVVVHFPAPGSPTQERLHRLVGRSTPGS